MTQIQLTCIIEHPTQWDPPLWAALACRVKPTVWYLKPRTPVDDGLGHLVSWHDESLARGYEVKHLENLPAAFRLARSESERADAFLVPGWTRLLTWHAMAGALTRRSPVLFPSDKILDPHRKIRPRHAVSAVFDRTKRYVFSGFVTTGSLGREALVRHGVRSDRIARALYPVDLTAWREALAASRGESARVREELGIGPKATVFITVCKLSRRESPLDVLAGFASYLRRGDTSGHLLMVGDGPLQGMVEARIDELGLRQHVSLVGYVPYQRLAAYYGAADVFIHMPFFEPWGISVLEASACGLPVVATPNVGAAVDVVREARTGALAPSRDPESIASALERAAALLSDRARLATNLAGQVAPFDVNSAAGELEDLLARIAR